MTLSFYNAGGTEAPEVTVPGTHDQLGHVPRVEVAAAPRAPGGAVAMAWNYGEPHDGPARVTDPHALVLQQAGFYPSVSAPAEGTAHDTFFLGR
jgi:hypothetical protein